MCVCARARVHADVCVNWALNEAVKRGMETAAHVSEAERLGAEMIRNSHVIRRWLRAHPDVFDDNIVIHFMHIF